MIELGRSSSAKRPRYATLVLIAAAATLALVAGPQTALAEDPCVGGAPTRQADIVGYTWSGTVIAARPSDSPGTVYTEWVIEFAVDKVYANESPGRLPRGVTLRPGETAALPTADCGQPGDLGLVPGSHYLVTAGDFSGGVLVAARAAAWEITGVKLELQTAMYGFGRPWAPLTKATTLDEALALARADGLPDTGMADEPRGTGSDTRPLGWANVLALIAAMAVIIGLRRRRAAIR